MQTDVQTKSKSLLGVTDLTLVATIKRGLIPALDSRSYESRLRLLMKTLNTLRISSLEAEPTPLIADAIDRIRALHSFRLAIVGQEQKQLLLAVAFDGGWEPYIRRIYRDLGPLLDVIFCNCEGYLLADDHTFAEYAGWIRSAQVSTEFFYNAMGLTVNDLHYLRESERERSGSPRRRTERSPTFDQDYFKQALPALTALYRLTDMYPPELGSVDGACLFRAAEHLLPELPNLHLTIPGGGTPTERAALRWFAEARDRQIAMDAKEESDLKHRATREKKENKWDPGKVQGGIIKKYEDITHGCLLLIQLKDAAAAFALLKHLRPAVTRADAQGKRASDLVVNLSFTFQGMQITGVPSGTLDQLPFEFREGMAARAGILGDLRYNHPTRWSLPERNWEKTSTGKPDRIQLSSVHAIVQYALRDTSSTQWEDLVGNPGHPLAEAVARFEKSLSGEGVRILSVQAMQRFVEKQDDLTRDHFGFVDGFSQPDLEATSTDNRFAGKAVLGDLLLGYENSLGDPPLTGRLWDDSTFLVIRKLRQDVEALNAVLGQSTLEVDDAKARLMGREVNGKNLIKPATENDFNYDGDPDGVACPLHSHARRANPRSSRADLVTTPRIMRRGMSYGPRHLKSKDVERGLVFMAYNASIAEQFEVIQSWLSGGNSGGDRTYSALHDPFLGVPQDDEPRTFAFKGADGKEERLRLDPGKPLVRLEWGVYAFVPSIKALDELQDIALIAKKIEAKVPRDEGKKKKEDRRTIQLAVEAQKGAVAIARLKLVEQALGFEAAKAQWKIALEDVGARMSGVSQWIWTAVRESHGGALRTPYGVLVCSKKLVMEVFDDHGSRYTADGYAERMRESFGEIYLGLDQDKPYRDQSTAPNKAIQKIKIKEGFVSAFEETRSVLKKLVGSPSDEGTTVEVKDLVDEVLAAVSKEWFGLPDDKEVIAGGWHWLSDQPPTCPGHFHSPSRYMFQPNPGPEATGTGQRHGRALNTAVQKFVDSHLKKGTVPTGQLGSDLFAAIPGDGVRLTRTLIGVMMGFLPTVDGNLRSTLYEWINDRSLWDYQIDFLEDVVTRDAGSETGKAFASARSILLPPLRRAMQLRPVPELAWRIAREPHRLGPVEVTPGDMIVISIVSAGQQCLINDDHDLYPIFGGDRGEAKHPTHACPGYKMAMGVMLGTLAGLMESARLRPTMSPMALRMSLRT